MDGVFPIDVGDVERAKTILHGHPSLSARDAAHVATMERHGAMRIMSFDRGFDGYPGIERLGKQRSPRRCILAPSMPDTSRLATALEGRVADARRAGALNLVSASRD